MSDPTRFHISLNVADLGASVQFFRTLFGAEPAKVRPDYAKFEPADPPLVLSLEPAREVAKGGALNHLGFRMPVAKALVAMQERLERAGLRTKREEGVECCYARQTKFWAHDPDGNLWEVYTFDGDIAHRGAGQAQEAVVSLGGCAAPTPPTVWEHRMNEPVPTRIPLADGAANEVRLRGTFNLPLSVAERRAVIAEAVRVLKPGGRVFVHVLTGEQEVESPELPGPAGAVRSVPTESDPVRLLEEARLSGIRLLKFDAKPCFVRNGVGMRETQVEGWKPAAVPEGDAVCEVLYRGPFDQVDADGRAFPRGVRVAVPAGEVARFRTPELSGQFTVFEPAGGRPLTATVCGV